jgi:hypothetical protein
VTGTVLAFILPTVAVLMILLSIGAKTDARHEEDSVDHDD